MLYDWIQAHSEWNFMGISFHNFVLFIWLIVIPFVLVGIWALIDFIRFRRLNTASEDVYLVFDEKNKRPK